MRAVLKSTVVALAASLDAELDAPVLTEVRSGGSSVGRGGGLRVGRHCVRWSRVCVFGCGC